jgi:hypothetical protein
MTLEVRVQPDGSKRAPLVPADGVPAGRGAGGSGAYVHTDSNIFRKISLATLPRSLVFEGTTLEGELRERNRRRFHLVHQVFHALYQAGEDEPDLRDHARRLFGCGQWVKRIDFACGTYRLVPCACNSIFCQDCSAKRSRPIVERILQQLDRKKRYWFLTITVENWRTLTREQLSGLTEKFSKLRETDEWKKHVTGGIYSVEATFNRQRGDWHPHFHVLIETDRRLPRSWIYRLRVLWRRLTGSHVINLQPLYGRDKKGRKTRKINRRALCELVKYATKAADFSHDPGRVVEFFRAFQNVRRVQGFGSFYGTCSREPGCEGPDEQENGLVGCNCGSCEWSDGTPSPTLFHISKTFLNPDGVRQLRLFDSGIDPPKILSDPDPPPLETKANLDLFFHQHEFRLSA